MVFMLCCVPSPTSLPLPIFLSASMSAFAAPVTHQDQGGCGGHRSMNSPSRFSRTRKPSVPGRVQMVVSGQWGSSLEELNFLAIFNCSRPGATTLQLVSKILIVVNRPEDRYRSIAGLPAETTSCIYQVKSSLLALLIRSLKSRDVNNGADGRYNLGPIVIALKTISFLPTFFNIFKYISDRTLLLLSKTIDGLTSLRFVR